MNTPFGEIGVVVREGFFSNDVRWFNRKDVEVMYPNRYSIGKGAENLGSTMCTSCSECNPVGTEVEIKLNTGEIVRGKEYLGGMY